MKNVKLFLVFTIAAIGCVGCGKPQIGQEGKAPENGLAVLMSRPGCRRVFETEEYHYKKFESVKNAEAGSANKFEFLPNGTVLITERATQCSPGQGFWGCRQLHTDTETANYIEIPNGFIILDSTKEPAMTIKWDSEKKKGQLSFLKKNLNELIGQENLEVTVSTCK